MVGAAGGSTPQPTDDRIYNLRMKHERRLIVLRVPTGGSGEVMGPSDKWVGLAAPLGEVGFEGAKPNCHTYMYTPDRRRSTAYAPNGSPRRQCQWQCAVVAGAARPLRAPTDKALEKNG